MHIVAHRARGDRSTVQSSTSEIIENSIMYSTNGYLTNIYISIIYVRYAVHAGVSPFPPRRLPTLVRACSPITVSIVAYIAASRLRVNRPRAKRWSADRLLVSGHPIIGGTALRCIIIQV